MQLLIIIATTLFLFYILSVVCETYFVPSIDILSKKLKLSSDAAGATLLAAGSSAPELFASIIAVFGLTKAGADVGAGTIVGSAIFNVLVIIGAAAMFKAVTLQWKPIIRDLGFYVLTILLLFFFFQNGKISLVESLSFLVLYGIYIFAVLKWKKWFSYEDIGIDPSHEVEPKGKISLFIKKGVDIVIPDVEKRPHLYLVTFFVSILVIIVASYVLVENLIHAADILDISPTFLALTALAAGTSLPDLIGSIVVAKQGRGDMAVSNAVGSNIFDILFGLGAPWAVYLLFNGGSIAVSTDNLNASILLLLATVVAIITLLIVRRWRIGKYAGLGLILLYVAYVIYVLTAG